MQDPLQIPLKNILDRIKAQRPVLVNKMAATALVFIDQNFQKGGFQGATFEPWQKRADKKDQSRPILMKSTALRRSPFKSYSDAEKAIITSSLPYSKIHNEGGMIPHPMRDTILNFAKDRAGKLHLGKVRTINQQRGISTIRRATIGAHSTQMPKRQFMGRSPVLDQQIKAMFKKEVPLLFKIIVS